MPLIIKDRDERFFRIALILCVCLYIYKIRFLFKKISISIYMNDLKYVYFEIKKHCYLFIYYKLCDVTRHF